MPVCRDMGGHGGTGRQIETVQRDIEVQEATSICPIYINRTEYLITVNIGLRPWIARGAIIRKADAVANER
jgi:hypothetical protein